MKYRIIVYPNKGQWHIRIDDPSGHTVLDGVEGYKYKGSALDAAERLQNAELKLEVEEPKDLVRMKRRTDT